ncbi:MAG TPA: zf-HC2 domain-containing protein [Streptosporangiaceae bacterium]|jgi:negative regulator of sigma E activity|nr:zf-HC2 domain-containing protein [Streptosporangiaceae bacterium]
MSHLGQRLSALVDGELSDPERDRVLAHVAACAPCRSEAIALRTLKQRMHSLGGAMADAALTGRLMAVPEGGWPWQGHETWRRKGGHAARFVTAGVFAFLLLGVGATAFMVGGGQSAPGPQVTPAVDTYLLQHAVITGNVPAAPSPAGNAPAPSDRGQRATSAAAGQQPASAVAGRHAADVTRKQARGGHHPAVPLASGRQATSQGRAGNLLLGTLVKSPPAVATRP